MHAVGQNRVEQLAKAARLQRDRAGQRLVREEIRDACGRPSTNCDRRIASY